MVSINILGMSMDNDENTYRALQRMLGIHEYLNKDRAPNLDVFAKVRGVDQDDPVRHCFYGEGHEFTDRILLGI